MKLPKSLRRLLSRGKTVVISDPQANTAKSDSEKTKNPVKLVRHATFCGLSSGIDFSTSPSVTPTPVDLRLKSVQDLDRRIQNLRITRSTSNVAPVAEPDSPRSSPTDSSTVMTPSSDSGYFPSISSKKTRLVRFMSAQGTVFPVREREISYSRASTVPVSARGHFDDSYEYNSGYYNPAFVMDSDSSSLSSYSGPTACKKARKNEEFSISFTSTIAII